MRIVINDFAVEHYKYRNIFSNFGYEENELIFLDSYCKSREFIIEQLENKKLHIDLVITNEDSKKGDILEASQLAFFLKNLTSSYSKSNFRINSIPLILFSETETRENISIKGFDSIIKKNNVGEHSHFINQVEKQIKNWRKNLMDDLETLEINHKSLYHFHELPFYKNYYKNKISKNAENYFALKTKITSQEFITLPTPLIYDWLLLEKQDIENTILNFNRTYNTHINYDRKNNERTILHNFFNTNKMLLLRDAYVDFEYEKNLYDLSKKNSEECDYILKTEFPEFLKTTFFEVKKEDVTFYVKKNTKRPQISSNFLSYLEQVYRYKEYSENKENELELAEKLGYSTINYDHVLLAGRKEEKLEMKEKFNKDINRMYSGIEVITYEELENININYYDKFNRLSTETK